MTHPSLELARRRSQGGRAAARSIFETAARLRADMAALIGPQVDHGKTLEEIGDWLGLSAEGLSQKLASLGLRLVPQDRGLRLVDLSQAAPQIPSADVALDPLPSLATVRHAAERRLILWCLYRFATLKAAAQALGISRTMLRQRKDKLGIVWPDPHRILATLQAEGSLPAAATKLGYKVSVLHYQLWNLNIDWPDRNTLIAALNQGRTHRDAARLLGISVKRLTSALKRHSLA